MLDNVLKLQTSVLKRILAVKKTQATNTEKSLPGGVKRLAAKSEWRDALDLPRRGDSLGQWLRVGCGDCRWLSVGLAHRLLDVFGEVGGSQIVIGLVDDVANVPDINAGEQCSSLVLELGSGRIARPCETDCGRRAKSVGEVGELTQDATGWHLTVCNIHSITAVVEKAVQNAGRIEKGDQRRHPIPFRQVVDVHRSLGDRF